LDIRNQPLDAYFRFSPGLAFSPMKPLILSGVAKNYQRSVAHHSGADNRRLDLPEFDRRQCPRVADPLIVLTG
jgi:hypothetical protein